MKTVIIAILLLLCVVGVIVATIMLTRSGGDEATREIAGIGKVSEEYYRGYWAGQLDGSREGWHMGFNYGKKTCTVLAPGTHTLECSPCPQCEKCSYWIKIEEDGRAYYVNLAVSSIGLDGVRNVEISRDDRG